MSKKKISLKHYFNYYLITLIITFLAFLFFGKSLPETNLSFLMKAPGCEKAELFFNSSKSLSLDQTNNRQISVINNQDFNQYQANLVSPVLYFRFDPCAQKTNVSIKEFEISYQGIKRMLSLEEIDSWSCVNCTKKIDNNEEAIVVSPLNNDPILFTDSFEIYQPAESNQINFKKIQKYTLYLLIFLILLPFAFLFSSWNFSSLSLIITALWMGSIINLIINQDFYAENFLKQAIGQEKILSSVNYFGYSVSFENLIVFSIFITPFILVATDTFIKKIGK